jgi:hypothetical protein
MKALVHHNFFMKTAAETILYFFAFLPSIKKIVIKDDLDLNGIFRLIGGEFSHSDSEILGTTIIVYK